MKKATEESLQASIVKHFTNNYCLKHHNPRCMIFAVPNGGSRNLVEAMRMKASGTLPGVSDLIVVLPNKTLFIELKLPNGIQSDKQKDFEQRVTSLGFDYHIVRSLEEFNLIIEKEL